MDDTTITLNTVSSSGTREWACKNVNIIDGCVHDCRYCYAKEMAIRFRRATPDDWRIEKLRPVATSALFTKYEGTVMFPSSHDITPRNLGSAVATLQKLLAVGNNVLIVTKPHLECIRRLCAELREHKPRIEFRFTIGSADSETLKFWEPGAPSFEERMAALKLAYRERYKTSISCEPFFDKNIEDLIFQLEDYATESIWVGRANSLRRRLTINGYTDAETLARAQYLKEVVYAEDNIRRIFANFCTNIYIRWKGSLRADLRTMYPDFPMF